MKVHIGTDTQGRVHSVVVPSVNVHNSPIPDDLQYGEESMFDSDKAFVNTER